MHVLVVDDDADIRRALRFVLEDEGYHVSEATDGRVALDLLRAANDARIVILDYLMPTMSGPELLAEIVQDPDLTRNRAFVLMSGLSSLPPEMVELGAHLHLTIIPKPFDIGDLTTQMDLIRSSLSSPVPVHEAEPHSEM